MSIITDLKDAVRKAIYTKDNTINFNFNEIQVATYPYIFFYIPSYKIIKPVSDTIYSKVTLMCVVEYAKSENNSQTELWSYSDTLTDAYKIFEFLNTKLTARNMEQQTVDGVLQLSFDLEFYIRDVDTTELMQELEFTIKEN